MLRPITWAAALALTAAFVLGSAGTFAQTADLKDRLDPKSRSAKELASRTSEERALNDAIRDFYAKRDYKPIWFGDDAAAARTKVLIEKLAAARDHGLSPSTYGMPRLGERVARATDKNRDEIEIELTLAYLGYAGDIIAGTVSNPRRVGGTFRDTKRPDAKSLLDRLLAASDTAKFLDNLPPDTRRYKSLLRALAQYRELDKKGGWPTVDRGPTLKIGMRNPRVVQAKKRLLVTGELAKMEGDADLYDGALLIAVKKFQERHGLVQDGNIGAATAAEMNVSVKDRVEQLVINLERRRWLAGYLGDRYIYVNIADHDLKIVEKGHTVYTSRVVVGRPYHETPVFSGTLSYIEFNPYWNVPYSIATDELLPVIKRVPGYLQSNDYLLLTRMGDNNSAIDPATVDWSQYAKGNFPFFIRQKPGPRNALGTTLFMFPNPHNVFIHDTPIRSIFNLEDRYFSHGCVRVENPWRLAKFLLQGNDDKPWDDDRIRKIIDSREQTRVNLKRPISVHITYLTAWAEQDGTVHFRRDAYRRDAALRSAMSKVAYAGAHR
ncbi:MAG: L,D-transpeptidase family protein [Rhodospirillaceae bacterium]|nr:L,D-transpeptidase family protein [Rhodospirillaceae bacterium]